MMKTYRLNLLLTGILGAVCIAVLAVALVKARRHADFPDKHWQHVPPDQAGFDPDRLADFVNHTGGHGLVIRNSAVVTWWGYYAHPLDIASACKPVYAHFVYAAISAGLIQNLDEPISEHLAEKTFATSPSNATNAHITWRDLLQQTACYGVSEDAGTAFNYSDYQAALLVDTLIGDVHGSNYEHFDNAMFNEYLADVLQFQDEATLHHERSHAGRIRISPRDFARFGLLYLKKGRWRGQQLIPEELAIQAVSSPLPCEFPRAEQEDGSMRPNQRSLGAGSNMESHMGSYSYSWWVNGEPRKGERLFPDLPHDLFLAQGHSGHDALLVVPSLNLIACWIDAFPDQPHSTRYSSEGYKLVETATRKLIDAIVQPTTQP